MTIKWKDKLWQPFRSNSEVVSYQDAYRQCKEEGNCVPTENSTLLRCKIFDDLCRSSTCRQSRIRSTVEILSLNKETGKYEERLC